MSELALEKEKSQNPVNWQEFASRYSVTILVVIGLVLIPVLNLVGAIPIETVNMLGRYMCFAIVAIGLDLLWGYTGILSLCQAFFFSLGGYAMGMYLAHHGGAGGATDAVGWDVPPCLHVVSSSVDVELLPWFWKPFYHFLPAFLLGLLIPGVIAGILGYMVFRSRVRGVYFAILTQAITVAAYLVFSMNNMKLCGTNGLTNFDKILGHPLSENYVKLGLYIATVLALTGAYFLCRYIVNSRLGRILVAVRDDENTLRFSGYQPSYYKMFAFTVAAMLAGLGGMLYAPQMGIFTPSNMEASASIMVVIWVAVGGRGSLSGAVLGALVINLLYNYLTSERNFALFTWKAEYWPIVLGLLFIGVVLIFPNGLINLWHRLTGKVDPQAKQAQ